MSVFDWENFYDWRRDVIYIIANMWGEKALVVSDDLAPLIGTQEWLTDLLGKARGDPIAEISSEIETPQSFTAKILQRLVKQGLKSE